MQPVSLGSEDFVKESGRALTMLAVAAVPFSVGLTASLALSAYHPLMLATILGISVGYAWMDFRLGTLQPDHFSFLPILALVAGLVFSVSVAFLITLTGPLIRGILGRDGRLLDRLLRGSRNSLILVAHLAPIVLLFPLTNGVPVFLRLFFGSALYCGIDLILRLIRNRFLSSPFEAPPWLALIRASFPLYSSVVFASLILYLAGNHLGFSGFILASAMIAELCYPWKLLNDQESLFLTGLTMVSEAVDLKDPYTARHSRRVAELAARTARALGMREDEVRRVWIGALMHDIGKLGVPVSIIRKPGGLTSEEMATVRMHPEWGAALIEGLEVVGEATDIVRHSHERYDGGGYPNGLKGEAIPIGSRIILVVDAFDALTTDRPYRLSKSAAEAIEILDASSGTQFDPKVVSAFKRIL